MVTDDGFIIYWSGHDNMQVNCRVKCPGGRIIPITDDFTFIYDGKLYSVRNNEIIGYEPVGDNDLHEKNICPISDEKNYGYYSFVSNYVRNTMLINGKYEFDGEKCVKLDNPVSIGDICTSKAWYTHSNTTFSKIAMKDYQSSEFQVSDYEMQTISATTENPNITFTGFRYSDGANVVGIINENDEVTIENVANNGEKIINLIPLN